MIKLIELPTGKGTTYLNPDSIRALEYDKAEDTWWLFTNYNTFMLTTEGAQILLGKISEAKKPQTALDELVLTTLVSFQRDRTERNKRPMWRCYTDEGQPVNIFLNTDEPEKNNYQLFKEAGWGEFLDNFGLHHLRVDTHIQIAMKKNGRFWEVIKVRTKPQSDMPDWAKENYLFDEIVTEEDETEGGAE